MKKQALCTVSLTLTFILLAGCGGTDTSKKTTDSTSADTSTITEETTVDLMADLPTGDFEGYKFNFLAPDESLSYLCTEIVVDEMNGEVINDAVFIRNSKVEEKLNIDLGITTIGTGRIRETVQASILAGDNAYDVIFDQSLRFGPVACDGYYANIYDIKSINLEKPWWDTNTTKQYEINGKLFFIQGDLNYQYLYNMWTIFFNQQIISDYKLENPYDLVLSGKWTVDKMIEYCKAVMRDMDNDGVYNLTKGDICGIVSNNSSYLALLHGCAEQLITKDKDNNPIFKGADDHFTAVYDKLLTIIGDGGVFYNFGSMTNEERWGYFTSDKFLFSLQMLGSAENFRNMSNDFGVIPLPKFNEDQKNYYNYVGPSVVNMAIPSSSPDIERTGIILENICAYSYGTLRTAYFETTLQNKLLRDEKSLQMLDIIYDNIDAELGYVFSFGDIHNTFINALNAGNGISSTFASVKDKVDSAITTYLEKLDN